MLYIGVDYGIGTGDLSTYVIVNKHNNITDVIESGLLSEFNYADYDGLELKIVGEKGDLDRFHEQFIK